MGVAEVSLLRMYTICVQQPASQAILRRSARSIPRFRADFLPFTSQIVEHSRYLPSVSPLGNLAECSTESASIIEFLARASIKPEPSWLVPLRKPKMPENERKPVPRLFHWKMICCYEMRKAYGSCVEPSPLKIFASIFDAETTHAPFPSNIQPNYHHCPTRVYLYGK